MLRFPLAEAIELNVDMCVIIHYICLMEMSSDYGCLGSGVALGVDVSA